MCRALAYQAGAKDIAASHVAVSQPSSTVKPSLRRLSPTDTVAQTPIPEEVCAQGVQACARTAPHFSEHGLPGMARHGFVNHANTRTPQTPLPATSRSRTSDPEPIPRKSGLAAAAHDSTARNETTLVTSPRDAALPYPTPSLSASLGDHHQPPAASGAKARPRSESPLAENAQQPMQSASSVCCMECIRLEWSPNLKCQLFARPVVCGPTHYCHGCIRVPAIVTSISELTVCILFLPLCRRLSERR